MTSHGDKTFIDTNMLQYAADFKSANIFDWITQLYGNGKIMIHQAIMNELLLQNVKDKVEALINSEKWLLFDPQNLAPSEYDIYQQYIDDVKTAFINLSERRLQAGKKVKGTSNLGEISIIAACLLIDAGLICSNDYDIKQVVNYEHYTYVDQDGVEHIIIQDSAEDFCIRCMETNITSRKLGRKFFKYIIHNDENRQEKLTQLNNRLS